MTEHTSKVEQAENELIEIADELTAMGDMAAALFSDYEDMEPETPRGIKILLVQIRKRIDGVRNLLEGRFRGNHSLS
jgi:DNA-directed RNA polymerase subunit F